MAEAVCMRKFREGLFFLSNFYPAEIVFDGITYPTSEAAYQAQKYPPEQRWQFASMEAKASKELGAAAETDPGWPERRLDVMYQIVRAKFGQHPELLALLLQTEDADLVEINDWDDTFWGVDYASGTGENHLGRILRRVKEEHGGPGRP